MTLNREPSVEQLISKFISSEDVYDRNHSAIPSIDASTHRVRVDGIADEPVKFSLADLKAFPQHTVICALQCAGNRRNSMRTKLKEVHGVNWFDGAVMNCRWRGPRLRDLLRSGDIDRIRHKIPTWHVAFECFQSKCEDDDYYGASIPLERAMRENAEVILALEMNSEPLTPARGFPVRIVTPGIAGARCVKWLDRISVQPNESSNFYQQRDYKILPPEASTPEIAAAYWPRMPAIQDMPVNSVVAVPSSNGTLRVDDDGKVTVRGYALPAGECGPVVKVEISTDNGETWEDAELLFTNKTANLQGLSLKWAWCIWEAKVTISKGKNKSIWSRAIDSKGNEQPMSPEWNIRGIAYNGYGEADGLEVI